jgi:hypothetical protein
MKLNLRLALAFAVFALIGCVSGHRLSANGKGRTSRTPASDASGMTWLVNDHYSCFGLGESKPRVKSAHAHLHFKDAWRFLELPKLTVDYTDGTGKVDYVGSTFDLDKSKQLREQGMTQAWVAKDPAKKAAMEYSDFVSLGSMLVGFKVAITAENGTTYLNCGNEGAPAH